VCCTACIEGSEDEEEDVASAASHVSTSTNTLESQNSTCLQGGRNGGKRRKAAPPPGAFVPGAFGNGALDRKSARLEAMDAEELLEEKRDFFESPLPRDGTRWAHEWPHGAQRVLESRIVRKRFPPFGTFIGKVVGAAFSDSNGSLFQVLYDDGDREHLDWNELRRVLVPDAERDLSLLEYEETLSRPRPRQRRDLEVEASEYLPRLGCHFSLPPGHVACHLHEKLRLAGENPYDTGPAMSD